MKGTEKQIKWAEDIKEAAYGTVNGNIELLQERLNKYPNWDSLKNEIKGYEKVREVLDMFFNQIAEASQVIDKRFMPEGEALVNQARAYTNKLNK